MPENDSSSRESWYPRGAPDRNDLRSWYAAPPVPEVGPSDTAEREEQETLDKKRRRRTRAIALIALALVIVGAALAAAVHTAEQLRFLMNGEQTEEVSISDAPLEYEDFRDYFANYYTGTDEVGIPRVEPNGSVTLEFERGEMPELSLQEIYARVSPAVVGVTSWQNGEQSSWGTGVVFSPKGYLVTNTHVIQGSERATVVFPDGRELDASLVGEDSASDIAVLKLEDGEYPYAPFGDSGSLRVGDTAVAIGNPLGEEYAGTMTNGIISAVSRSVQNNGHSMNLLQTNAALNEGNSGGPLINARGQVVGITNMKIMSVYYSTTVEGIGFAIPSELVKQVADQLLAHGIVLGTPSIGITAAPVTAEAMAMYGLPMGVYVSSVNEGSDALEKGMQVGDIILRVNGVTVASVAEVNTIKDEFSVGDTLTLTVYRDGKDIDLDIVLVDRADIR